MEQRAQAAEKTFLLFVHLIVLGQMPHADHVPRLRGGLPFRAQVIWFGGGSQAAIRRLVPSEIGIRTRCVFDRLSMRAFFMHQNPPHPGPVEGRIDGIAAALSQRQPAASSSTVAE